MNFEIRRFSMFLSWVMPYYWEKLNKFHFKKLCLDNKILEKELLQDIEQDSNSDESFFFICLNEIKLKWKIVLFLKHVKPYLDNISKIIPDEFIINTNDTLITVNNIDNSIINILPQNILIIEDTKWIKVWENFLRKYWINNIKVVFSEWCSDDRREKSLQLINQLNNKYNFNIFRIIDRGWLPEDYVDELIPLKEKKYNKFNSYKFIFLPVNEVENFILLDKTYNTTRYFKEDKIKDINKFLNENFSNLELKYDTILNSKLNEFSKELELKYWNTEKQKVEIKNNAKTDLKKYINGKDIIKYLNTKYPKSVINPERFLESLGKENFPIELIWDLEEIKQFFTK